MVYFYIDLTGSERKAGGWMESMVTSSGTTRNTTPRD